MSCISRIRVCVCEIKIDEGGKCGGVLGFKEREREREREKGEG